MIQGKGCSTFDTAISTNLQSSHSKECVIVTQKSSNKKKNHTNSTQTKQKNLSITMKMSTDSSRPQEV